LGCQSLELVLAGRRAATSSSIANETLEKGKAAAEQSAQAVEKSYSATVENMRAALGQKMAGESAEPIVRGVNQVFKKAS